VIEENCCWLIEELRIRCLKKDVVWLIEELCLIKSPVGWLIAGWKNTVGWLNSAGGW